MSRSKQEHTRLRTAVEERVPLSGQPGESREPEEIQGEPATLPQAQRAYLETLLSHTPDAFISLDADFHLLDLNAAASAMLGCAAQEAVGRRCSDVLKCHNLNKIALCGTSSCPLVRVLQFSTPLPHEELLVGEGREASVSVTPVHTGEGIRAIFIARDSSALKFANQVRSNFVSMVSHELRTPLNSVHGFIDLFLQGHMGELTSEQRTYLGYTQEGVQQLISMVEDILFMTRADVGQFKIKQEAVNVRVLARQVFGSLKLQAGQVGVALRISQDLPIPSPLLYADPQRMKQVLNNLVTNAIKFTPPGGTVTVNAEPYDEQFLKISVVDTGFGILPEDRPHVFERFYQSNHSQQSRMGGYGLGLSIARLIVEQHGGIIDFEAGNNGGTVFYFTAPRYIGQDKEFQGRGQAGSDPPPAGGSLP